MEVNVPEPQKGNAIAIASLVLGILAALACWIPFIGLVAIPLGLLGLLLGTIGLTLVVVVKRRGLAAALVGTVLSLAAMVLSFAITGITSKRLSEAIEKSSSKDVSIAKAVAAAPANAVVSAPKDAHTAPAPRPDPEAVSYPESARLGEVEVRVTRVLRGEISLRNLIDSDRHERSQDPFLSIYLEVKNVGDGRKLDYRTFEGTGFRLDHATLGDDLGNRYRSANFGFTTKPEGQADAKSLYPGEVVTDQLAFEIPVAKASSLTLELPAEVAGLGEGVFRFKIPASAIETLKSD